MSRQLPQNSWELYRETVSKADGILREIMDNKPIGPLLNQFVHILAFQQGISVARWINNNVELARRLNGVQSFTKEEFDELAALVKNSVEKLKTDNVV